MESNYVIKKTVDGPGAEEGDWKKELELDLDKIKYEVATHKKKKGKQKKISKEDRFVMASLQPACHTPKFSNEYFLTVTTDYDGCVCCINLPDAKMPMTIVPLANPNENIHHCRGDDWNPTLLVEEPINVNAAHEPDSD